MYVCVNAEGEKRGQPGAEGGLLEVEAKPPVGVLDASLKGSLFISILFFI